MTQKQEHRLVCGDLQDAENPLIKIDSPQSKYLICYLKGLGAKHFVLESAYFDCDYLAEFAAYYSTSARGYQNYCKRIHFFSEEFSSDLLHQALGGSQPAHEALCGAYLGFTVIRPIPVTPIGRTVLRWFPNKRSTERVTTPSREYRVHLAGLPITVTGLAWQQQDAAVAACATIGLWTILHSSAFDDSHFIPTTVEITRAAEGFGARSFPSPGLTIEQIQEAIKKLRLAPIRSTGSVFLNGQNSAFHRAEFASICASFIRSGFPVLLGCDLLMKNGNNELVFVGKHAVCAVGMRENDVPQAGAGIYVQDAEAGTFYLHDDNIGPNARFRLIDFDIGQGVMVAALEREQPDYLEASERDDSFRILIPQALVIAVHENFRISPKAVQDFGKELAEMALSVFQEISSDALVAYSARFFRLASYLHEGVGKTLSKDPVLAAQTRMKLSEIGPMSLHVGVIRLSLGNEPLMDAIIDTTDGDHRISSFAHVVYSQLIDECFDVIDQASPDLGGVRNYLNLGIGIKAYHPPSTTEAVLDKQ